MVRHHQQLVVPFRLSITYEQFRTFFLLGAGFLTIAVVVLFMERKKIPARNVVA